MLPWPGGLAATFQQRAIHCVQLHHLFCMAEGPKILQPLYNGAVKGLSRGSALG